MLLPRISFLWVLFLILVNYLFPTRVRNSTLFFTHPTKLYSFPHHVRFPTKLVYKTTHYQDIDQCVELEAKGFPPEERCSREKFNYRLTVAPELCAGLFVREYDYKYNAINLPEVAEKLQKQHQDKDDDDDELPSHSSVLKETLIGHVIATKIASTKITDASMQLPSKETPGSGHIESSRNIGIHSVVIHPDWRGKNLGALLLHDYIQKLSNQDVGDQIVIINKENLIPFYEKSDSTTSARVSVNMLELHGTIWQSIWSPPMISSIYF